MRRYLLIGIIFIISFIAITSLRIFAQEEQSPGEPVTSSEGTTDIQSGEAEASGGSAMQEEDASSGEAFGSEEAAGQDTQAQDATSDLYRESASEEGRSAEQGEVPLEPQAPLSSSENVSLDFREADITTVLRVLSYKSGVNIVAGKEVAGPITIRLADVPWNIALDVILKTYGYGYERTGNIITVMPIEQFTAQKEAEQKLAEVQPVETEVFHLKFIDANDAKKVLEPQLSARGKITVLVTTGQKGWSFGRRVGDKVTGAAPTLDKPERKAEDIRSKLLVVSDIPPYMEKMKKVIDSIDKMPKQILIEARIIEVNRDKLKDFGFDWGLGGFSNATTSAITTVPWQRSGDGTTQSQAGGHSLGSLIRPAIFQPKAAITELTPFHPYTTGLELIFQKVTGTQFETILHALLEDVSTNVLSSPRVMTLDNQEANIMVGTLEPILAVTATASTTSVATTQTLDYYENIGIQLSVVPQISADKYINMIIHPVVTSYTNTKTATSTAVAASGTAETSTEYPYIEVRETETQVIIRDRETVVIGGLLKDVKSENILSVPILGDIPIIGELFKRKTKDSAKIDLLIFITATIVSPDDAASTRHDFVEMNVVMPSSAELVVSGDGISDKKDLSEADKNKRQSFRK